MNAKQRARLKDQILIVLADYKTVPPRVFFSQDNMGRIADRVLDNTEIVLRNK